MSHLTSYNGAPIFGRRTVEASHEINRISKLPRRTWTEAAAQALAADMTRELKTRQGTMALRPVQAIALYEMMQTGGLLGPIFVGGGKCLGRGTPVLMFNGSTKPVEEVCVGDTLMGPDSDPRVVKSICQGREELYRIVPVKGDPYVVNASHVLSLQQTKRVKNDDRPCNRGGRIKNLTVKEFLAKSSHFRLNWKGYRVGITFPAKEAVEPYMLGMWLGDGSSARADFTTADPEIVSEIYALASRLELQVRVSQRPGNASSSYHISSGNKPGKKENKNILLSWLRALDVINNKHIPHEYKVNCREVRLEMLAGLIDSDGYLHHGGYDFVSSVEQLADDVCFLARSLGFAAYKNPCRKECVNNGVWGNYFRVSISGDLSEVPCRIPRKRAPVRKQKKSVLMTGIRAEPIGLGDYFGFELEGADRLFLLGDFTVTHNTLLSLLAPVVLEARRPVLLLPAALIEKTQHERMELAKHWRLPTNLQTLSYEIMGRVSCAQKLDYIRPDLLVCDECHRLKNLRAGVSRRVKRYMHDNPTTKFVGISGTIMKSSLKDFAHILRWALKNGAPIPMTDDEVGLWADALDERVNPVARCRPGALLSLGPMPEDESDALSKARRVFQSRLLETPGVVASGKSDGFEGSLYIRAIEYDVAPITEAHFDKLRTTWTTPDDWAFSEALELWRHARSLALGLHSIWDPRPPQEWLAARKAWASCVREILGRSQSLDTELQVVNAVDSGSYRHPGAKELLAAWRAIKGTFTPNPKDVWHDDSALRVCEEWAAKHRAAGNAGIIWVSEVFFAKELARRTGLPYYGADGLDAKTGRSIVQVDGKSSILASIAANSTGRNLQCFSHNLITSPPPGAMGFEQLLGRTHRQGQLADEVTVDVLLGCREHYDAVMRAREGAAAAADTLGHDQKILLADLDWPDSLRDKEGARWATSTNK